MECVPLYHTKTENIMEALTESFEIVLVSRNRNAFGLQQFIAVSGSMGMAFRACANYLNVPKVNSEVLVPMTKTSKGHYKLEFAKKGWEIGEVLDQHDTQILMEAYS